MKLFQRVAFLLVGASLFAPARTLRGQASFTKITTGAIVTDVAENFKRPIWGDYNNDGFLDVYVNNYGGTNVFYRNNGDGTFRKITQGGMVDRADTYPSPSWADFDNDGNLDLLVPAGFVATLNDVFSRNPSYVHLFRNNGDESFSRVTGSSVTDAPGYYFGAWLDYDNDGWVDLLIGDIPSSGKLRLHRNDGGGRFLRTADGTLPDDTLTPWSSLFTDFDGDGYEDMLFVVNDHGGANVFYHNERNGTFRRVTNAISSDPWPSSGFGNAGDTGDYDNDGYPDVFLTGSGTGNRLYRNNGDGTFTKILSSPVLNRRSASQSVGCAWGDYDNDGYLDLFVSNIHGRNQLFRNNRDGTFSEVLTGFPVTDGNSTTWYFGASWADYDNDGFLDLFVAGGATDTGPGRNLLYHNNRNGNSWLEIRCVGTVSNRSALGAKVRVSATLFGKSVGQLREIHGGAGYWNQPLMAHFGLGDATNVDVVRIEWPSGIVQELENVRAGQILTVTEPPRWSSSSVAGTLGFSLKGGVGLGYQIESSDDLRSWRLVSTVVATNATGTIHVEGESGQGSARRFYRARLLGK